MKTSMKQARKEYQAIEEAFYDLDREQKTVRIRLQYEKPEKIFDCNAGTKIPLMSADFIDRLISSFDCVPDKYRLKFQVSFDDLDGYTGDQLADICKKNILQETRTRLRLAGRQNRLAMILCGIGLAFILLSIYIGSVWTEESVAKDIVVYILDIIATVPFWGAMEICIIDNRERRRKLSNIRRRFNTIEFRRKDA